MGKGDRRRPTMIPQSQADANFESIFGKRVPTYLKKMIPDPVVTQDAQNEDEAFKIIEQQNKQNKE
jgi:hypothetical protein